MLKIAFKNSYVHPLPEGHRFPMMKYELIIQQLIREGVITDENLFEPQMVNEEIILLTHKKEYWEGLKTLALEAAHIRRIGFPLTKELVERERYIVQGTIDCALFALQYGIAMNVAGGTHHAFEDKGEGFCLLNDFAIAANYLLQQKLVSKIAIIDLDVHQGNGTAQIFRNEPRVFTFSVHGRNNYPFHKEKSDMDVALKDGVSDEEYLQLLQNELPGVLDTQKPQLVFFQSGVDILETDKMGKLSITEQGCLLRDEMLFRYCQSRCIPLVVAMGGGYSPKISDLVNAHCNTFKRASKFFFN